MSLTDINGNPLASASQKPLQGVTPSSIIESTGCDPGDGILVSLLNREITDVGTAEYDIEDGKNECPIMVVGRLDKSIRVMDLQQPSGRPVKWWRVKQAAARRGMDTIPIRWEGQIQDIPQRYLEGEGIVALRFYAHGPWFFPREQPVIRPLETEQIATAHELLQDR
jgi:hypothetical protein